MEQSKPDQSILKVMPIQGLLSLRFRELLLCQGVAVVFWLDTINNDWLDRDIGFWVAGSQQAFAG